MTHDDEATVQPAVGTPVERPVGRLVPEAEDAALNAAVDAAWLRFEDAIDSDDDEPVCPHCCGDGMDPMTDYLLPCWVCQREQRP